MTNRLRIVAAVGVVVSAIYILLYYLANTPEQQYRIQRPISSLKLTNQIFCDLSISPSDTLICVATTSGADDSISTLWVWDWKADRIIVSFRQASEINGVAYSPDGTLLAASMTDGVICIWDATTWVLSRRFLTKHHFPTKISFSADSKYLAIGGQDDCVDLYKVADCSLFKSLGGHGNGLIDLMFSTDNRYLASVGFRGPLKLWAFPKCEAFGDLQSINSKSMEPVGYNSVAISPDSQSVATAGADRIVRVWSIQEQTDRLLQSSRSQQYDIRSITYSPSGKILACGCGKGPLAEGVVSFWNIRNNNMQASIMTNEDVVVVRRMTHANKLVVGMSGSSAVVEVWLVPNDLDW